MQTILEAWKAGGTALDALESDTAADHEKPETPRLAYLAQAVGYAALFLAVFSPLI